MDNRVSAREGLVAATLALVAVSIAWMIAAHYGVVGIPRNDDWVYYRAAFHFADTHSFEPESSSAILIGLVLLAYPIIRFFGDSIIALQLLVAALGAVGLWSSYMLARGFLSGRSAAIAVTILAVGPMFGNLTVSFMTDVPAFALQIITLLLGAQAMKRTGHFMLLWLGLALAVGLLAFSIREYALAAGATVAIVGLHKCWFEDRHTLRQAMALTAAWAAVVVVLYLWRQSVPNANHVAGSPQGPEIIIGYSWLALQTMAILVAPVVFFLAPKRVAEDLAKVPRLIWLVPLAATGAVVVLRSFLGLKSGQMVFLGNYFSFKVPYAAATSGISPQVIPEFVMDVLMYASQAGTVILIILLGVWLRRCWSGTATARAASGDRSLVLVGTYLGVTVLGFLAVLILTRSALLDRYLLAATPLLAALLLYAMIGLGWVSSYSRRLGVFSLAPFAVMGLFYVDLAASFDAGKWKFDNAIVDLGFTAATIDGGYEWFGIHQSDAWRPRNRMAGESWWVAQFSKRPVCVWVRFDDGSDPVPGEMVIARREIRGIAGRFAVLAAMTRIEPPEGCPANSRAGASDE